MNRTGITQLLLGYFLCLLCFSSSAQKKGIKRSPMPLNESTQFAIQLFQQMTGELEVNARMRRDATSENYQKFQGEASMTSSFRDYQLKESFDFGRFKGIAFISYSQLHDRFELFQIDSGSPSTIYLIGQYNEHKQQLVFEPIANHPQWGQKNFELKWIYTLLPDQSFKKEMWRKGKDGQFFMQSDYHYVPKNDAVVCWSKDRPLSWNDFRGKADKQFAMSGVRAAITDAEIRFQKLEDKAGMPDYKIASVFLPNSSWATHKDDEAALQHEQLHFDIAELYARKLRQDIASLQEKRVYEEEEYQKAIDRLLERHDKEQQQYDAETIYQGKNPEKQAQWIENVQSELQKLETYAFSGDCNIPKIELTTFRIANLMEEITSLIDKNFVDPTLGTKIVEQLQQNQKAGKYDAITDYSTFSKTLTKTLYDLSDDLHLRVDYQSAPVADLQNAQRAQIIQQTGNAASSNPNQIMRGSPNGTPSGQGQRIMRGSRAGDASNANGGVPNIPRPDGGFFQAELLAGDIGYVNVPSALPNLEVPYVKDDLWNAMELVKDAKALIFDVRTCPGGMPQGIAYLASFIYGKKPILLNTYHNRNTGAGKLSTFPDQVPFHFSDLPVYVLTSKNTASGGEAFAYMNQQHGRVKVVGEVTRGAGRLSRPYPLNDYLVLLVPENRSEHPVSKTGFEKVGVQPDITINAQDALYTARKLALEELSKKDATLQKALKELEKERIIALEKAKKASALFEEYQGKYGIRSIHISEGKLMYQKEGQPDLGMQEVKKDFYELVLPSHVRTAGALPLIRFDRVNGRVVSISFIGENEEVQNTILKENQ